MIRGRELAFFAPIKLLRVDHYSFTISIKIFITTDTDHTLRPVAEYTETADMVLLVLSPRGGRSEHFITIGSNALQIEADVMGVDVKSDLLCAPGLKRTVLLRWIYTVIEFVSVNHSSLYILFEFGSAGHPFQTQHNVILIDINGNQFTGFRLKPNHRFRHRFAVNL